MNIGVKFCGQCNPVFRLRPVFDYLSEHDKDNTYSFYKDEGEYDEVIILCGCPTECATVNWEGNPIKKFHSLVGETADKMGDRVLLNV